MNHGNSRRRPQESWNPVTGCSAVSAGCDHCYARRIALRLQAQGAPRYANGFQVTLHEDLLMRPLHWRKPRGIFVNSMSDVFHPLVPFSFLARIFTVMRQCPQHRFMIITKRAHRLPSLPAHVTWPHNLRLGVTVESAAVVNRIDYLRSVPAAWRFLCCEPLLGPLPPLDLTGIHHVIVGQETGPNARPMAPEWVDDIRTQCLQAGVGMSLRAAPADWPENENDMAYVPDIPECASDNAPNLFTEIDP